MRIRPFVLVVVALASFGTVACGGAPKPAESPDSSEANPWSDFKGTYASGAPAAPAADTSDAPSSKAAAADTSKRDAKGKSAPAKDTAAEPIAAPTPAAPARKSSSATIKGESVSSIGTETLADAAKGASKLKVVSSSALVGGQYEQVMVQLKGANVVVIRPAASPNPDGPMIASPKQRNDSLSKTETAFYDADSDVIVVVGAGKKPVAAKVLKSLVKK